MNRILLVMLPGAGFAPDDYQTHGFLDAVDRPGWSVRPVVAPVPEQRALEPGLATWLHETCIAPAMREPFDQLWLLGISLGGMGALRSLRANLAPISGLILISPFLGTRGTIAEVTRAGGLERWTPGPAGPDDIEIGLLTWLKTRPLAAPAAPTIHLACGTADRFAAASRLLADQIPPAHVHFAEGGHDWPCWTRLWHDLLDRDPFTPLRHPASMA